MSRYIEPGGPSRWSQGTPQHIDLVPSAGGYISQPVEPNLPRFEPKVLLRRYWVLLLILPLAGILAGAVTVVLTAPVYKARVMLEMQGINEAWLRNSLDTAASYDSNEVNIQTQIHLLRSGPFLRRVFLRLQTETVPLAPAGTGLFSRLRQRFLPDTQDPLQNVQTGLTVASATFDARPVNRTRLVELTCSSTSPEIASQFLNTISTEFIEETTRARMQNSQKTSEWLTAQIEETKAKLHETEERLQEFIQSSGNLFVSQDTTLDDAKLVQLRGELSRMQADRISKQTKYDLTSKADQEQIAEVLDDGHLRGYRSRINELRREKAALETTFTPQHPKVQKLDAQLASLEKAFRTETQGVLNRIRNDYEIALRQEKSLTSAYVSQSQRVSAIGGKAAQYNALKREVETLRQMYQSLLMQANQTGMTSSVPVAPIRLVDPSSPAREPSEPVPALNISFGCVAGLALAAGIVFLREKLDSRVKSPGLSRVILNAPELGVIPSTGLDNQPKSLLGKLRKDEPGHNGTGGEIGFWEGRPSVLAESFRGTLASLLRTKDEFGRPPQVALVTSGGPGEGKTMISANLGIALAETGRRVLLVDGDFRRPRLHQIFRMPNERSLMDLLMEDTPVTAYPVDALGIATPFEGLFLLPNRLGRGNITQALYLPRLGEVFSRLREHYDMILIDSPPVLHLADARIVAKLVDGVILVIRAGKTDREVAVEAYQRICEDGLSLIGTVLNDWNPAGTRKSYYYYSYSQTEKRSEGADRESS